MVINTIFVYHFVNSNLDFDISSKKKGNRKRRHWNRTFWQLCTRIEVSTKFYPDPACFFVSFRWQIGIASKSSIFIHLLLIKYFWFLKLWLKIKEKIHTKATVDMPRGRGGFVSCYARDGLTIKCTSSSTVFKDFSNVLRESICSITQSIVLDISKSYFTTYFGIYISAKPF